jgi:pyruvate dehydrogenase E2 component (dihydrolipoamide acetyltransferase)
MGGGVLMERIFTMPDLGEGLEEGRITEWLVAEGDEVELNQPLVEVETAKATVEIPSPFAGRIVKLHGAGGEDIPVGSPLVTFEVSAGSGPATTSRAASPLGPDGPGAPTPPPEEAQVSAYPPFAEQPLTSPAKTTPPVRKLAKALGVDIRTVEGTGPEGRVTEQDVRRAAKRIEHVGADPDPVRRSIAETLTRQAQIPQVTTFRTLNCSALQTFRKQVGVSPLPVVIAALCRVIEDHPLVNARWMEDGIEHRSEVHVGIATDTPRGLVVPVVQDAHRRGIADLATEIKRLAETARRGTIALEDLAIPATIAVSNTGSYGSEAGTPILSPGTSVTLAIGVIQPRALVVDDQVVARPAATRSLTFDHRVLDGAAAGRALTDLVALLQSAERLEELPR